LTSVAAFLKLGVMKRLSFCRACQWMLPCVLLLLASPPLAWAKERPRTFFYLAVPACDGNLISVACIKLNRQGVPAGGTPKTGNASATPFFSIWYSTPWEQKAPEASVTSQKAWEEDLETKAKRALAESGGVSELPVPIAQLFLEIEKLRCATTRDIILQPLFKTQDFVGWEHEKHLNVLATVTSVGAEQRAQAILASLAERKESDPAKALRSCFTTCGIKTESVRYWSKYNVFLIEAGADFEDFIETLFSPLYE
jgi:hypothetical protein